MNFRINSVLKVIGEENSNLSAISGGVVKHGKSRTEKVLKPRLSVFNLKSERKIIVVLSASIAAIFFALLRATS
jgi:hypothetical protein